MTDQQPNLDTIEAVVRNAAQLGADIDPATAAALVDEVRRLRVQVEDQADADTVADRAAKAISAMGADLRAMTSERNRYRTAWRLARTRALSTGGAADRYAVRAREGQTALQDMFVALLAAQMERDEAQAEAAALKAVLAKAHTDAAPAARSAAV